MWKQVYSRTGKWLQISAAWVRSNSPGTAEPLYLQSLEKELRPKWRSFANTPQFPLYSVVGWHIKDLLVTLQSSAFPVLHTATLLCSQLSPGIITSSLFSELPCLLNHWQLLFLRGNIKWWGHLQISLKQTVYHLSITSPSRHFKAQCVEYCRDPFVYQRRYKEV